MNAIEVNNLTKIYKLYNSPRDRLRELLSLNVRKYHHEFYALKNVSFTVEKGQTVGIIGQNGSGKSTLLKIICGVVRSTSGNVRVNGRISSLLELGAGFNPDFTGRENVYMNGALMGFSKEEMESRFPDIESFADIGEFIDQPVKSYSSGMYVRLAFSTAINVDPEILIIDEALSVGDMFFQAKCTMKMKAMIDNGVTLLFVSHAMDTIKSICKRAVHLSHGELIDYGDAATVVEKYFGIKVRLTQRVITDQDGNINNEDSHERKEVIDTQVALFTENEEFHRKASFERIQNGKARFANIQFLNSDGKEITHVNYEEDVTLRMAIEVFEEIPVLTFSYHIRDKNGIDVVYSDSPIENKFIYSSKKGDRYIVDWKFKVSLKHGQYNIACFLGIPIDISMGRVDFCDSVPLALQFKMAPRNNACLYGSVHWDNQIEITNINQGEYDVDAAHRMW